MSPLRRAQSFHKQNNKHGGQYSGMFGLNSPMQMMGQYEKMQEWFCNQAANKAKAICSPEAKAKGKGVHPLYNKKHAHHEQWQEMTKGCAATGAVCACPAGGCGCLAAVLVRLGAGSVLMSFHVVCVQVVRNCGEQEAVHLPDPQNDSSHESGKRCRKGIWCTKACGSSACGKALNTKPTSTPS